MKGFGELPESPYGLPYILSIDRKQAQDDFQQYYNDYVKDIETFGIEDNDATERLLKAVEFPSFQELLDKEPATASAFLLDVAYDFLNTVFTKTVGTKGMPPIYFIMTVDQVKVLREYINLSGMLLDYRRQLLDRIGHDLPDSVPCDEAGYGFNSGYWEREE